MPAVGQGAQRPLYVLPAALVLEGAPHRLRNECTPLTPADSPVELGYEVVVETYVPTHGHMSAQAPT